MLAAIVLASAPTQPPVAPQRQAQATVTIVASAALRFSEIEKTQPERLREAQVRAADGSTATVRLVEYQ